MAALAVRRVRPPANRYPFFLVCDYRAMDCDYTLEARDST